MGVKIESTTISVNEGIPILDLDNNKIGELRSGAFSPRFKKIVGIAMVKKDFSNISQKFQIKLNDKLVSGEICSLPIL